MSSSSPIVVGYWNIRGLASALRMIVMYNEVPLICENYDLLEKEEGGFSASPWMELKPALKEVNPLMNLPYMKDGDILITQSNACLVYLGKKFDMLGGNFKEEMDCHQLLCEVMDLRNQAVRFFYGGDVTTVVQWLETMMSSNSNFAKLEAWKALNNPSVLTAFIGVSPTVVDFHIWEMCDQFRICAKLFSAPDPLLQFPLLQQFHHHFREIPRNQRYFQSKLAELPLNNLSAVIGSTPSGVQYVHGQKNDWKGSSGTY